MLSAPVYNIAIGSLASQIKTGPKGSVVCQGLTSYLKQFRALLTPRGST